MDAYIARYGSQDVHKLRGITRPLTPFEKACFCAALHWHMEAEFTPLDTETPTKPPSDE